MRDKAPLVSDKPLTPAEVLQVSMLFLRNSQKPARGLVLLKVSQSSCLSWFQSVSHELLICDTAALLFAAKTESVVSSPSDVVMIALNIDVSEVKNI